jgi:hypothetical protein
MCERLYDIHHNNNVQEATLKLRDILNELEILENQVEIVLYEASLEASLGL